MNIKKFVVINWHITESCNYHCNFCFAKWNKPVEIWSNPDEVQKVLSNISQHFRSQGIFRIRLNIVGGEPIMFPERLWNVVEAAYNHEMEISIITNGSHLENIRPFAHLISQVGISIDSLNHETNMKIGRECCGKTISFETLREKIEDLRKVNPDIKIKLNTVVNNFNFNEVLVEHFAGLHINKWKILRQRPFNGNPGISDYQFNAFLRNNFNEELMRANAPKPHTDLLAAFIACEDIKKSDEPQQVIYVENKDAMTESYLMVSPDGHLFQNGNEEYTYSRPLTEVSFADALSDIKFDNEKFESRYGTWLTQEAVNEMEYFFHLVEDNYDVFDCFTELSDD